MISDFFRSIKLALPPEQFRRLPRNAGYKYELIAGEVWLTPRPRWYHAVLELRPLAPPAAPAREDATLRRLAADDWEALPNLFAGAFRTVQPFGSLDDEERLEAARKSLGRTRGGGDGPLVERASFVAVTGAGRLCGALVVTLIPDVDLTDPIESGEWPQPPPPDAAERGLGLPHLTWVFVSPFEAGHGIGTALLAAAVAELLALGYDRLASTFLLGNESSMLWHWRNGFRLLPHPGSWRELRRRWND